MKRKILITGGAGFIGSHVVRLFTTQYPNYHIINLDKLTYAGNLENLKDVENLENYKFIKGDIVDSDFINTLFDKYDFDGVIHLAAESHVDRSIDNSDPFIRSNIIGTYNLLESARCFWGGLNIEKRENFKFIHISTDEVFGSLGEEGSFDEETPYSPRSPYSASKASSDHLVSAWQHTYNLPTLITNCSNNFGPWQFPEKLIPLVINKAIRKEQIPIYGDGKQIRDWLHVRDHVEALYHVCMFGNTGETYNIGGVNEVKNIDVALKVCAILDDIYPINSEVYTSYSKLIKFVDDRPGHDKRYAIDCSKIKRELNWCPNEDFDSGMLKTVKWYLTNYIEGK